VDGAAHAGGEAQQRAEILRDVGLVQDEIEHRMARGGCVVPIVGWFVFGGSVGVGRAASLDGLIWREAGSLLTSL
jgi:hypothetical protein